LPVSREQSLEVFRKELGQLVEKRETKISLKDMTDDELAELYAFLNEPVGNAQSGG
jgi:hypothetical protein